MSKNKFVSNYETESIPENYELLLYKDIDTVKENIDKIYITDLFDGYSDLKIPEHVYALTSKLSDDGEVHIQGLDFNKFCSYIHMRAVPWTQKIELYRHRVNCQSLSSIEMLLKSSGLHTTNKRYVNGYYYYICCKKDK